MAKITVTYEIISEASAIDGDFEDHGFICERYEDRHSVAATARSMVIAKARTGRYDWSSIRAALEYCLAQRGDGPDQPCGQVDSRLQATFYGTYDPSDPEEMQCNVTLFVEGVSDGTLARLARVLEKAGVYFG